MKKLFFLLTAFVLWSAAAAAATQFMTPTDKINLSGFLPMASQVTVYGSEVTGDVTMTLPEGVKATPATIAGADLSMDKGIDIQFVFTAEVNGNIEFNVPGMENPVYVPVISQGVTAPVIVNTLADFAKLANGTFAMYTGEAVVTAKKNRNGTESAQLFWMQDETAGVRINTTSVWYNGMPANVVIGDKLTNVMLTKGDANESQMWFNKMPTNRNYEIVSQGNEVQAKVFKDLEELTPELNNILVEVKNLKFDTNAATFTQNTLYTVLGGKLSVQAQPFGELYGKEIPEGAIDMRGIYTMPDPINLSSNYVIRPRTEADFITSTAPAQPTAIVKLTSEKKDPIKMGAKSLIATFFLTLEDLKEDGKIEFGGDNAAIFSAEPAVVEAKDGVSTVNIYATGTAIGVFDGTVTFNFGSEDLNSTFNLQARVYDEAKLPVVTLNEYVAEMYAPVGESAEKKFTLTMENCFEPVTITPKDTENTTLVFDKTTIDVTDQPVELTLTFTPVKEGKGVQQFTITTPMIDRQVILQVTTDTNAGAINVIASDADGIFRVFNAAGVLVLETRDAAALKSLAPGLYIINGRKQMLR